MAKYKVEGIFPFTVTMNYNFKVGDIINAGGKEYVVCRCNWFRMFFNALLNNPPYKILKPIGNGRL